MTAILPSLRRLIDAAVDRILWHQRTNQPTQGMPQRMTGGAPRNAPKFLPGRIWTEGARIAATFCCELCGNRVVDPFDVEQLVGRCLDCQQEESPA